MRALTVQASVAELLAGLVVLRVGAGGAVLVLVLVVRAMRAAVPS